MGPDQLGMEMKGRNLKISEMENVFGDYYDAIFEEKLLKMPEQEQIPSANVTALLEKRRELAEVEAALASQKEEFQVKLKLLQQRREELNKKEEELKQSFIKFDKFLEENDAKQKRAKSKIITETELIKQKEKDLVQFKIELEDLIKKREKLKKKVEAYSIYPKFLENVIKMSKEFQDIRMVNTRFETLFHTYDLLIAKYNEDQEVIKTIKANHNQFMKEKNNDVMTYHNSLAALQARLEDAKAKVIKGIQQHILELSDMVQELKKSFEFSTPLTP
ncbi:coiled-coil domain-containing protein 42 homolog [Mustelus asterias]